MIQGILIKGYSGFYYVYAEDRVWECSLRGRFRIQRQEFLPGDKVKILPGTGSKATIESVEPRANFLTRPTIANVDQALLVFALTTPEPDFNLLDRLIVQVLVAGVNPILVLTKFDRWEEVPQQREILNFYAKLGYPLIMVSNKTGQGIPELKKDLAGKVSVLAGPSGVGKSSLLNSLAPEMDLKTGEISHKLNRGRHTTRHVELMVCAGGLVADTPGFSSLYLPKMKREELARYFADFTSYAGSCRFSTCLHDKEPSCAVKEAVEFGEVSRTRYEHYLLFLQEVIANERRY